MGGTGIYYSGDQQKEGTYAFNGIFARIQYAIKPNFNLILGNYGDVNHRLIEPLYRCERQMVDKLETYTDLDRSKTDYSFGIYIRFKNRFFLGRKK